MLREEIRICLIDKLPINKTLFKDAYSKSQESDKLSEKRFELFFVKKSVANNAVKLELLSHLKILYVFQFLLELE